MLLQPHSAPSASPTPSTPSALLAGYARWLGQLGRSPRTVTTYTRLLARYFQFAEATPWPTPAAAWLGWQAPAQTRRLTGCALRRFRDFGEEFSFGVVWCPRHLPRRSTPQPQPIPWRGVAAVLRASRALHRGRSGASFRGFVLLLWATGARRSEAAGLTRSDLRQYGPGSFTVRLRGKGGRDREVPLPQRLARILHAGAHPVSGSLWPGGRTTALGGPALAKMWRQSLAAAGLPRVRLHQLRHSRLSRWAETKSPWTYSALSGQVDLNSSRFYVPLPASKGRRPREWGRAGTVPVPPPW